MSNEKFFIYTEETNDFGKVRKMYFTGTKWGIGYFNLISGAYEFDDREEAEKCKEWLDESLVVPIKHFIEVV